MKAIIPFSPYRAGGLAGWMEQSMEPEEQGASKVEGRALGKDRLISYRGQTRPQK